MLKTKLVKGALAVSTVAALFAALAVQAQTGGGSAGQAGTGQSSTGQSGSGQSGLGQSGTGQAGTGHSGSGRASTGQSGAGQSGTSQAGTSQAGTSQAGTGQAGTSQSGTSQSGMSQSGTGQSGMSQSGTGQSGTGQSGMSQSGTGQSNMGRSGMDHAAGQTGRHAATGRSSGHAGMQSGTQAGASTASGGGTMGGPALSRADQKLIKDMAMANLAEVEAGRIAQGKTQSDQVKNFAQQMIDDHTKALGDVQQLAQAKGVALPTELDLTHKRKADRMAALSGEAFDRAYMAQSGLADHKMTHSLLQRAQSRAKDPDLKALAARTMPIVDQHLSSAQQLHRDTAHGSSRTQGTTGASPDRK